MPGWATERGILDRVPLSLFLVVLLMAAGCAGEDHSGPTTTVAGAKAKKAETRTETVTVTETEIQQAISVPSGKIPPGQLKKFCREISGGREGKAMKNFKGSQEEYLEAAAQCGDY